MTICQKLGTDAGRCLVGTREEARRAPKHCRWLASLFSGAVISTTKHQTGSTLDVRCCCWPWLLLFLANPSARTRLLGRDRPEAQHLRPIQNTHRPREKGKTPWNPGVDPPVSLTCAVPTAQQGPRQWAAGRPHELALGTPPLAHRHGGSVKPLRRGAKPRAQTHRHIHPHHEQRVGGDAELRDDK